MIVKIYRCNICDKVVIFGSLQPAEKGYRLLFYADSKFDWVSLARNEASEKIICHTCIKQIIENGLPA